MTAQLCRRQHLTVVASCVVCYYSGCPAPHSQLQLLQSVSVVSERAVEGLALLHCCADRCNCSHSQVTDGRTGRIDGAGGLHSENSFAAERSSEKSTKHLLQFDDELEAEFIAAAAAGRGEQQGVIMSTAAKVGMAANCVCSGLHRDACYALAGLLSFLSRGYCTCSWAGLWQYQHLLAQFKLISWPHTCGSTTTYD